MLTINALSKLSRRAIALILVAVVAIAGLVWLSSRPHQRTVTAYFTSASSLYPGNPVEVLGVPVGSVGSVTPGADGVKVEIHLDQGVKLPAGVKALQVSPSLISGRNITLTPAYSSGPELADGAVIPVARTAVPLDVNDLFKSANQLATALGPKGANRTGSLTRVLRVLAANLKGNGSAFNVTLHNLAGATGTLAESRGDLTGTITGLQRFVSTLAQHDGGVRQLNHKLALVFGSLSADRTDLSGALRKLSSTVGTVARFVRRNRALVRSNVDRLSRVSRVLVHERALLGQLVDEAPLGLGNLLNAYNAANGTLDVRLDLNELSESPVSLLCTLIGRGTPASLPSTVTDLCNRVANGIGPIPSVADLLALLQGNGLNAGGGQ